MRVDARLDRVLLLLRRHELVTAHELARALDVSQPTISRLLRDAGEQVVALGNARARRYAARRELPGMGHVWPLYRLDYLGRPMCLAQLHPLHGGRVYVEAQAGPEWLRAGAIHGLHPGLPWFLRDLRPRGFAGRVFARRFGPLLGLDKDLAGWGDDDVLIMLLRAGADATGHLVLGETALEAALSPEGTVIRHSRRAEAFARILREVATSARQMPRDQLPCFPACVETEAGSGAHVLVTAMERDGEPAVARRWADLLHAEHVSHHVLAQAGLPVASMEKLQIEDGVWALQVGRADRVGLHGRRGWVSLAGLATALSRAPDSLPRRLTQLRDAGWIGAVDADWLLRLWWFGRLLGDADGAADRMGFQLTEEWPLPLARVSGVALRCYQPLATGKVPDEPHVPPPPLPEQLAAWRDASQWALTFWEQLVQQPELSPSFRILARLQQGTLAALRRRFA